MESTSDHVALIKSLATSNRFYALAPDGSGIRNAEVVEEIPHDLLLGIAYPCLEDGLNDFAVIRTSFETLDLFKGDAEMTRELEEMISDARMSLTRRLMELLERLIARKAFFLGIDLEKFKASALDIMKRGFPRADLDRMMKVNVFSSVAEAERQSGDCSVERGVTYRYEFNNSDALARLTNLPGREFLISLFADVLDSVLEDDNYRSRYFFDKNVFQQFIALMFLTYAATDTIFYGTNPDDYGVSKDKNMDGTSLYRAISQELHRIALIEARDGESVEDLFGLEAQAPEAKPEELPVHLAQLPIQDDAILSHLASICAVAHQVHKHQGGEPVELTRLILADVSKLVQELKRLGVLSPLAYDPGVAAPHVELPEKKS